MSNFFRRLNIHLNNFLVLLGARRYERYFGIVYDSVTKQPLDPVMVKLVDARDGRIVQSAVTDMAGRYNFLARPGKFKILVKKTNFSYPSEIARGSHDGVYGNLYHGEIFTVSGDSDVLTFNIPMDPESPDWNQTAKGKVVRFNPYVEKLAYTITRIIFWFVFILVLLSVAVRPIVLAYELLAFYCAVFLLVMVLPRPRWWGKVYYEGSGQPAAGAVVELLARSTSVVIAKARVLEDGKFFVRVEPGDYTLRILRPNVSPAVPVAPYERALYIGSERVVNGVFAI